MLCLSITTCDLCSILIEGYCQKIRKTSKQLVHAFCQCFILAFFDLKCFFRLACHCCKVLLSKFLWRLRKKKIHSHNHYYYRKQKFTFFLCVRSENVRKMCDGAYRGIASFSDNCWSFPQRQIIFRHEVRSSKPVVG